LGLTFACLNMKKLAKIMANRDRGKVKFFNFWISFKMIR
ncbi:alpha/beta hydrolase, partial [Pseudolactococcus chungangensis]